jgi:hypothetical protein
MTNKYPKTLKALNKFVQHEINSSIMVVKGDGYFYITSDNQDKALEIAALYQTSIYVNSVNHLSFEGWYSSINQLFNNK